MVVAYINTSAAVKAESDYCCTSANASKVVSAIPADKPILFVPDKFLATVVARQTGRTNIIAYPGYCHVHKSIRPEQVVDLLDQHPDIELLLHPECGCVSSCMAKAMDGTLPQDRILHSLETLTPQITVPAEIAPKARRVIDRMLELA